jgi:hypothetical protein
MDTRTAIMAYSQSEKIKSGLIWISQLAEITKGMNGEKRFAGENMVLNMIAFVANEANLAKKIAYDQNWEEIEKNIEKARVMLHSGIFEEITYHLTKALSQTTGIGQKSMSYLLENRLI